MVAGRLQEKKGFYYMVLSYTDEQNERQTKWLSTKIPAKRGNKKKAEDLLQETRKSFKIESSIKNDQDMLFSDYLIYWLSIIKQKVANTTYSSYDYIVNKVLVPHYKASGVTLVSLSPKCIQDFYSIQMERVNINTVVHFHAVMHKALKYAVKSEMLKENPVDKVDSPRPVNYMASYYDGKELGRLFEICKDTYLEIPVLFGAFYGLRRSEVVGLRWEAINFKENMLIINHTVTSYNMDGKRCTSAQNTVKTKSSLRTLPLVPPVRDKLLSVKARQDMYRDICGKSYDSTYKDYICVNQIGERIKPDYISSKFPAMLEKHNMRRIRFHDLRHSCASLLLVNGVSLKHIQEWLGHSNFSTTANIYAHLDFNSKKDSAIVMQTGLSSALSAISNESDDMMVQLTLLSKQASPIDIMTTIET